MSPTEKIQVKELFRDDNAHSILAKCIRTAARAGWSAERVAAFAADARKADYDHLLQTVMKYFEADE